MGGGVEVDFRNTNVEYSRLMPFSVDQSVVDVVAVLRRDKRAANGASPEDGWPDIGRRLGCVYQRSTQVGWIVHGVFTGFFGGKENLPEKNSWM